MKYKAFFLFLLSTVLMFAVAISFLITEDKRAKIIVLNIITSDDTDNDGINDIDDLVLGARREIENETNYYSAYYAGGYPPNGEGVCSDVIWRAFKSMGYDLKSLIDEDIQKNLGAYSRVEGNPDSNIDFRRVLNLQVFFQRNHESHTIEIIPGNVKNLSEWQAGDVVIFGEPKYHIAIISDKRDTFGIPYMIHNSAPSPREDNWLVYWNNEVSPIIGHYRIVNNWNFIEK